MKKNINPIWMVATAALLAAGISACSNETLFEGSEGSEQRVTVKLGTRATDGSETSSWMENDLVKVLPTASSAPYVTPTNGITFKYTKNGDTYTWQNNIAGGDSYFTSSDYSVGFVAYYPATDDGTTEEFFRLPQTAEGIAEQSDAAKLHAADYMTTAETTVDKTSSVLDFNLSHRLCRVTFTITEYGSEYNGVLPNVTNAMIKSQHKEVNVAYYNGIPEVTAAGSEIDITPLVTPDAGNKGLHKYEAIVTPCTLTSGTTPMMTLNVNGTLLTVKYKGTLTALESGTAYSFNLKVGKDVVAITSAGITPWVREATTTGNTTNVALPEVTSPTAGMFVYYGADDIANVSNAKLSADNGWMIDHLWKSQNATPHIVVYSPYSEGSTYTGTIALANGTDYCYASVNSDHTKTVGQLLTDGKLSIAQADYKHVMTKVTVNFGSLTPTSVTLNNLYAAGTLTLSSGVVSISGDTSSPAFTADADGGYTLYVVPQAIAAANRLITATINGKTYYYHVDANGLKLTSGEHLTLTLSLPAAKAASSGTQGNRLNGTITIK